MSDDPRVRLDPLDPGRDDPGYWIRFRARVMANAGPALARRRSQARPMTVSDVMLQWARGLIPTALAAATLAGFMLLRQAPPTSTLASASDVEEILLSGRAPIPTVLASGAPADVVDPDPEAESF